MRVEDGGAINGRIWSRTDLSGTGHEPTFSSHLHDHATPNAWGTLRGLSNHASLRKQGLAGSLA